MKRLYAYGEILFVCMILLLSVWTDVVNAAGAGDWNHTPVTIENGPAGYYTDIAIDSQRKAHISYHESGYGYLKYATNASGIWSSDEVSFPGDYTSIAVDANGKVFISYVDSGSGYLDVASGQPYSWDHDTVSLTGSVSEVTSIALDANGKFHVSYHDAGALRYATGVAGSSGDWNTYPVDNSGSVGNANSIALDSHGHIHISYYDPTNGLKYAIGVPGGSGPTWSIYDVDSSTGVGEYNSIAVDAKDNIHISYYDPTNGLKYAMGVTGPSGLTWDIDTVDATAADIGRYSSLAVDANARVHISYQDATHGYLKYAQGLPGPSGMTWSTNSIDSSGNTGFDTAIAVDASNMVHISYRAGSGGLKYIYSGYDLTVTKTGDGYGSVLSSPFGITCDLYNTDCSDVYGPGSVVTLQAIPGSESYFGGWSWTCSSGTCTSNALTVKITMDLATEVTATFTSTPPSIQTWAKTYGGGYDDVANSIQQTSDGGYVVAGSTYSSAGGNDVWILKLNSNGLISWQKTYGGGYDDVANSIQQTSDGGYIVAGYTGSSGAGSDDVWILKLNSNGLISWQKTYGEIYDDHAKSIQQTSDGGYIVAGETVVDAESADVWILKLNSDGSVAWLKTYGESGDDYANSIQQTSDGGYIAAGSTGSVGAGSDDVWILKLNSDGSIAWLKIYGGSNTDVANSIQQTSDGGYIVAGSTGSVGAGSDDVWILKLNSDGSIAWQNTYGGSGFDHAYSIQQTSDGGYVAAGETYSSGAGSDDIWVLKLYSNGSVDWQKTYGGSGGDVANSIQQTSDGGYIVAGYTDSSGAGSDDFWLLKLDPDGNIADCSGITIQDTSVSAVNLTATVTDTTVTGVITTVIPQTTTITPADTLIYDADACSASSGPHLSVDPLSPYHFGNVNTGSSATRTFTITNTGDAALVISQIGSEDTLAPPFSISSDNCTDHILPPLGTCTFAASFAPSAVGQFTDTFDIYSNAPNSPMTFEVQGFGVAPTYTLNVTKSGTGTGSVVSNETPTPSIYCGASCTNTYASGTAVTLTATADAHSAFSGWTGACTGTGNCQVTMNGNKTVYASFTKQTSTVSTQAGQGGSINPTSRTVGYGETTQFTVAANTGYYIESVSGCGGTQYGNIAKNKKKVKLAATSELVYTTGQVTAACTVTASFAQSAYTVTPGAGAHGSISPSSPQTVPYNGTALFTITPDTGYRIASVSGCGVTKYQGGVIVAKKKKKVKSSAAGEVYITGHITESCTISASFAINTFTVTPSAGEHGNINPSIQQTVDYNGTTSFYIAAEEGYHIESVFGCGGTTFTAAKKKKKKKLSAVSEMTYTTGHITESCPVTASFAINTFIVTPKAGAHGSIDPSTAQTINDNEKGSFTVTPDEHYHIASVTGCGGSLTENTYTTGNITGDCTVEAEFGADTFIASILQTGGSGTITGSGISCEGNICSGSLEYGSKLVLKIKPDAGYRIIDVKINGKSIGPVQTITLKEILSNFTIEIVFGPA